MKNNNITPPHDLGAERAVLGSMLFTSDALINVMGILKTEDFYYNQHRYIFEVRNKKYILNYARYNF